MRKNFITPVLCASTIVAALVLSGCGGNTVTTTTPAADTSATTAQTTPAVTTPAAATTMTGADIATKLTAGGFTFTSEDQASKIAKLTTKDDISKGTKYKIKGTEGNIDITVLELSKPEKMSDVEKEIDGQLAVVKQISPTMNTGNIDVGAENLFVIFSYRTADKDLATKIISSIAKK